MPFTPSDKEPRRSLRLPSFDYGAAAYFVTICANPETPVFSKVSGRGLKLSDAGRMLSQELLVLPKRFEGVRVDESVVMPDHVHLILFILPVTASATLPKVMQAYKSITTLKYAHGVRHNNWEGFQGKIWQRSYHDSIISGQDHLQAIRTYIRENPKRNWERTKTTTDPTT